MVRLVRRPGGAIADVGMVPVAQADPHVTIQLDLPGYAGTEVTVTVDGADFVFTPTTETHALDLGMLASGSYDVVITIGAGEWTFTEHITVYPPQWLWHDGEGGYLVHQWLPGL